MTTYPDLGELRRDDAIARIKAALRRRSGKAWSVTGGRGTAWGWIRIDAPPARRTWREVEAAPDHNGRPTYEAQDSGRPGGSSSPADRHELAALLGLERMHCQGESIPASSDYYTEFVDRAEGRAPRVLGRPYWD
jgi:hypothetical protein